MGRSLEPRMQIFGTELFATQSDGYGIADKFQYLDLEDHGERAAPHRRPMRKSRWSIRIGIRVQRRRRVRLHARLHVSPWLDYLRTLRQSMARSAAAVSAAPERMDPSLPRSKLGVWLAKLHISRQRGRRVYSFPNSDHCKLLDDQARHLLLHCNPSLPVA